MKIIYDVGCNSGQNINYYLKKSDLVVAIEANPFLTSKVEKDFKDEIKSGRLIVENIAIHNDKEVVDFFVHSNDVLSTLVQQDGIPAFGVATAAEDFKKIQIKSDRLSNIIKKYGYPHYLKIDIEQYDNQALEDVFMHGLCPFHISVELSNLSSVELILRQDKYSYFNIVDGASVSSYYQSTNIQTNFGEELFSFAFHSAGPFGEDIKTKWFDGKNLSESIEKAGGTGWKDFHATQMKME